MLSGEILGYQFKLDADEVESAKKCLSNWVKLNSELMVLDEETVVKLLVVEAASKTRQTIIDRLYSRYSSIRSKRERLEVMQYVLSVN